MTQLDKLREAFLQCRGTFRWSDCIRLLEALGYDPVPTGKTSGSARKFFNAEINHFITLHAPHGNEMKPYQVRDIRQKLQDKGLL